MSFSIRRNQDLICKRTTCTVVRKLRFQYRYKEARGDRDGQIHKLTGSIQQIMTYLGMHRVQRLPPFARKKTQEATGIGCERHIGQESHRNLWRHMACPTGTIRNCLWFPTDFFEARCEPFAAIRCLHITVQLPIGAQPNMAYMYNIKEQFSFHLLESRLMQRMLTAMGPCTMLGEPVSVLWLRMTLPTTSPICSLAQT